MGMRIASMCMRSASFNTLEAADAFLGMGGYGRIREVNIMVSRDLVERLIGTIRREYLDVALFWTAVDLESKLSEFRDYYNLHRSHASLARKTPEEPREVSVCATLKSYRWGGHCRGLFHTPIAA